MTGSVGDPHDAVGHQALSELPAAIWDAPSLKNLVIQYSELTEIPLAATRPESLLTVDFYDSPLVGDQTSWLQSLGQPGEIDIVLSNFHCLAEITDPAWAAWISQRNEDWRNDGCQ